MEVCVKRESTVLLNKIQKSDTGDNNLVKWKRTFTVGLPDQPD